MLFGRNLRLPADLLFSRPLDVPLTPEEYVEKLQVWMEEIHHLARERISMASEEMKTRYDTRAPGHDFHEGYSDDRAKLAAHLASLPIMLASLGPFGFF
ncbi:retrovirus-related Pol polyprotein from transposon 412 [Trichonephila clavipes]|nr:retrovirus-related Pol polyprotein from transposon 412 [Trichonephila clavipes]